MAMISGKNRENRPGAFLVGFFEKVDTPCFFLGGGWAWFLAKRILFSEK